MSYGRKHEGGNVRSYGINTTLKVVSLFFPIFFEGEGAKRNVSIRLSHQKIIKTKFKMSLLKMIYQLRLLV